VQATLAEQLLHARQLQVLLLEPGDDLLAERHVENGDSLRPGRPLLSQDRRFVDVDVQNYDWNQTCTAAAWRKLMLSFSGTQMMDAEGRKGLLDDIEAFIRERFNGEIIRPLVVTLTTAKLV
jgi:hypothetical protein